MKTAVAALVFALLCPLTLHAEGKVTYSGIPCQWSCTHKVNDPVGLKKTDPAETQEDRRIMASQPPADSPGVIERGDGKLLLGLLPVADRHADQKR